MVRKCNTKQSLVKMAIHDYQISISYLVMAADVLWYHDDC